MQQINWNMILVYHKRKLKRKWRVTQQATNVLLFICNIIPTDSAARKSVMHLTKHVTISKALMLKLIN